MQYHDKQVHSNHAYAAIDNITSLLAAYCEIHGSLADGWGMQNGTVGEHPAIELLHLA